ncbi:aroma-sacti cluster domain-containing protein [Nonomuraea diastatica]|uniref:Uncharacterized protein n=1 Tax=Nonomuraea diastatica TaxID=1848329 RepID=A0A4R4WM19_9ACTN|nr:aroma-sacti cluster domain-containing protein [Nonomuraea diastatica]TDD14800.1 hypothetical protein E1294_36430 [Nonomuraea diastatica]
MTAFDPIQRLREAGIISSTPASHLEEGHQGGLALEVLATLTEAEVEVIKSIRRKMNAAAENQDVMAHSEVTGAGLW